MWLLLLIYLTPEGIMSKTLRTYDTYEDCMELVITAPDLGIDQSLSLLGCAKVSRGQAL